MLLGTILRQCSPAHSGPAGLLAGLFTLEHCSSLRQTAGDVRPGSLGKLLKGRWFTEGNEKGQDYNSLYAYILPLVILRPRLI